MNVQLLIVDDEMEIRKSLSTYFRSIEYDVENAANGAIALEIMAQRRFDVLISDIAMPVLDGVDLLRQVRIQYPMTRVVMITGYVTLENALACMRHGADDCVFKPFSDLSELQKAVEMSVLSLRRWEMKLRELVGMKPVHTEKLHAE